MQKPMQVHANIVMQDLEPKLMHASQRSSCARHASFAHSCRLGCHSPLVMVRNRSWPAVSQICSLIHLLSSRIFLILKSILPEHTSHRQQRDSAMRERRVTMQQPQPGSTLGLLTR